MKWDAKAYDGTKAPQVDAGRELIALAEVKENDTVLDVGCGTGSLTKELAGLARNGEVIGIDPSDEMLAAAREKCGHMKNITLLPLTAQTIDFHSKFDLVFSNSALQWVRDQEEAVRRIYTALKKGGRIAFQLPAKDFCPVFRENVKGAIKTLGLEEMFRTWDSPWYFPTDREYYALLRDAGFTDIQCSYREYGIVFGSINETLRWWRSAGLRPFLDPLLERQREYFQYAFAMQFEESRTDNGIEFTFRRLFAFARK